MAKNSQRVCKARTEQEGLHVGTGEMAQQCGAPVALAKDRGLSPSDSQ